MEAIYQNSVNMNKKHQDTTSQLNEEIRQCTEEDKYKHTNTAKKCIRGTDKN
jgi:hypothetical protein